VIEVRGLRKTYGDVVAVDDVSFRVEPGEVFGLLGPNGAGKSTTIGCLSGLVTPSAGAASVLGRDVATDGPASRRGLGVVPQELAVYEDLSATANLRYWGAAFGLRGADLDRRVGETLSFVNLADRAKEPVKRFSGGMKRRLNFAAGIVHEPKALLLDEPTVGVDPQSRARLLDMVRELASKGAAVVYTTHYMEEAEALCDRLAIVDHGRIIAEGAMDELRGRLGERDVVRLSGRFDAPGVAPALEAMEGLHVLEASGVALRLAVSDASHRLAELFAVVAEAGGQVSEATVTRPSLESLFLELTGRELRE
jgi:ABC-2 type transport system ATP-binding protein